MTQWQNRFWNLSKQVASWSKDRSRGVGAVVVNDDNRLVSTGYNGFPCGCNDDIEERHERPLKYLWTEHAERNAIYSACRLGVSLIGATMYVTLFPCSGCARGIVQVGIKEVVTVEPDFDDPNWGENWKVAKEIFHDGGVKLRYYENTK